MRKKLADVIDRIEEKLRLREEKIGNYLMGQYKNKRASNSLHNISADITNSKVIDKEFSSYQSRIPKISPSRHKQSSGFPHVKLPQHLMSSK